MWRFVSVLLLALISLAESSILYNGNNVIQLGLDSPFLVEIVKTNAKNQATTVASFSLSNNASVVKGSKSEQADKSTKFELNIEFNEPIKGTNGTLNTAKLNFVVIYKPSVGYWTLTNVDVSYEGNYAGSTSLNIKEALDVISRPGVTQNPADQSCERGFSTCAPKNLCWTCSDQLILALNVTADSLTSRLVMPGVKLQPWLSNSTQFQFGYVWDCDPLIPLPVWVGLFVTLTLVALLSWALSMLVNLMTPNRFDDPRSKGISVPLTE